VGIGIGHENHALVASGIELEARPRPGADHLDNRRAFGVFEHVVGRGLLNVENLAGMGRSAWNWESRADFAVPRAESPSTMNSSLPSTSLLRQSASFAGNALDSSAFLRR